MSHYLQDRFKTGFKTCGTGSPYFEAWGVGAKSLGVKAGLTDTRHTELAVPLGLLEIHLVSILC